MAKVPPVNATIEWVGSPGGLDPYGDPEPAVQKWAGTAPAYVTEQVLVSEPTGGLADTATILRAAIPASLGGTTVNTGDEITLTKNGETTTRRVRNIEERSDYGFVRVYFYD